MNEDANFFELLGLDPNEVDVLPLPMIQHPPKSFREAYIDMFNQLPTAHGTTFDNGTRWCEGCQATRIPFKVEEKSTWSKKACPECEMIWPEYEAEFRWKMHNDPDFMDDVDLTILMPWDIN